MKSNEEFIAGIYEKAAVYTEENRTGSEKAAGRSRTLAKVTRIAAMAAVCIGLAGVSALVPGRNGSQKDTPEQGTEEYGIALTSEVGEEAGGAAMQFRMTPVAETVTFTGVVESVDEKENRIWLRLEFEETAPADCVAGSMVCIRWDMLEEISPELTKGTRLRATGTLSMYENETSEYNGCAELVLTDTANLWQWIEERNDFGNYEKR
ncbi:MAG: hypothetical protein J6J42_02620 [Lachnospiraceae bacterium]|nr:hypothetical protein [Lachnospiraceae bacterium]MBP3609213.1 hypothetical protein [Lachnospiraceae bacterium]